LILLSIFPLLIFIRITLVNNFVLILFFLRILHRAARAVVVDKFTEG